MAALRASSACLGGHRSPARPPALACICARAAPAPAPAPAAGLRSRSALLRLGLAGAAAVIPWGGAPPSWGAVAGVEEAEGRQIVTLPSGVGYSNIAEGGGEVPKSGDVVVAHVVGYASDAAGSKPFIDTYRTAQPIFFTVGVATEAVPEGLGEALGSMRAGSRSLVVVPPSLGYGARGGQGPLGRVPGGSQLYYEVEILRCVPVEGTLACCADEAFPCAVPSREQPPELGFLEPPVK
mmetsp:Transcript_5621/g.19050  ORF Transcript_5621/g.19050 Transcript_5621/m.19050 type:complete len:238 (+) Transcript_5621:920-1633(+)